MTTEKCKVLPQCEDLLRCEEIPLLYTAGVKDAEQVHNVALLKRFAELYLGDPAFRESYAVDAEATLAQYALPIEAEHARFLLDMDFANHYMEEHKEIPLPLRQFYAFSMEKVSWRNRCQMESCVPTNYNFKKWRQRQVNRCWGEFSGNNAAFIHVPLVFELSLGCSVGCPFCALASQPLTKLFRATEENTKLWREVLTIAKRVIGPAAGEGVCYCASEPLDNPDYEVWSALYAELLDRTPQITTAVAMRKPERTKVLISTPPEKQPVIHRFSVLDLATFRRIIGYFTPEELLYVELLTRYDEALNNTFTRAGRSYEGDDYLDVSQNYGTSISCSSGFIVNMADQSIRLTTPCNANPAHPTGEIQTEKVYFTDAADFEQQLLGLIKEYMPASLDTQQKLQLPYFYRYGEDEEGIVFHGAGSFTFKVKDESEPRFYKEVGRLLAEGGHTAREIALEVSAATGANLAYIFNFLRYLYNAGAIEYTE